MSTVMLATGCIHIPIAFDDRDRSWHYSLEGAPIEEFVRVVVPPSTRAGDRAISSFSTGIAYRWHAQYGRMFLQALEVELPYLFRSYELVDQPSTGPATQLTLEVSSYDFSDFAAHAAVSAELKGADGKSLVVQRYFATGRSGADKMVGLGVFGMKSAVRQSTLDAYREILSRVASDVRSAMRLTAVIP